MIELKATEQRYEMTHENGYNFTVITKHDPEYGWRGDVTFGSSGAITSTDAVFHLRNAAREFLRQLDALAEKEEALK